uniref:ABC1 atypical kinase-like domain-containing protein n=1 Tax=Clastoptera arizonana TaxID=38151 RepID=A0A1B6CIR2_9HEMI
MIPFIKMTSRIKNFKILYKVYSSQMQTIPEKKLSIGKTKLRILKYGIVLATCGITTYYFSLSNQEKRFYKVTFSGIAHFIRSSSICAIISLDYWWSLKGLNEGTEEYENRINETHQRAANLILQGCLKNGGLYIKFGQGLVSMDHVLPKEFISTLKVLQDKCLTRSKGEVKQLFIEDFGKAHTDIFKSFDEEPIAAASLAQVFKAETKDGMKVAVKAQYIDLQDRYIGDIATIQCLLRLAGFLFPKFNFEWILVELKDTLKQELDFLHEGKNSEQCAKELEHFPFVYIPKINWDLSSKRILTAEFIDGIKINEKEKLVQNGFTLADIDYKLFKIFSEQIFHTGFVHADPHPGNVLVRHGVDNKAQLVLLDHGLYEFMPFSIRHSLCNLWKSIVLNDHYGMKKYALELGVEERDYRLFCIAIAQRYISSPPGSEEKNDVFQLFFTSKGPQMTSRVFKNLSGDEKEQIRLKIIAIHDRSIAVFKAIPSKLMLITRNINTIRSIARNHGDPVDRYTIMARSAVQGAFVSGKSGLLSKIAGLRSRIYFEIKLWWDGLQLWLLKTTINSMISLGFMADVSQEKKN